MTPPAGPRRARGAAAGPAGAAQGPDRSGPRARTCSPPSRQSVPRRPPRRGRRAGPPDTSSRAAMACSGKPQLKVGGGLLQLALGPFRVRRAQAASAFERELRVKEFDGGAGSRHGVGGRQGRVAVVGPGRVGQQVLHGQLVELVLLVPRHLVPQLQPALHTEPVADDVAQVAVPERNEVPARPVDDDLARVFHVRDDAGAVHPREPGQRQGPGAGQHFDEFPGHRCFPGVPGPDNVFQRGAPVKDHLIHQGPHRSGQHEVAAFDLLRDHGLQQRRAAADQLVQLAGQGAGHPVPERCLEHLEGFDLREVGEPDLGQLPGGDEPVEVRRKVRGALGSGDKPRGPGLDQVEQHAGAQFVQGSGVVQQNDALASGGVVADQGGDAVQDGRRRAKGALRQACEREGQAAVGRRRARSRAAELEGVDVGSEARDGGASYLGFAHAAVAGDDHAHPVLREQGAADPVGVGIARQT